MSFNWMPNCPFRDHKDIINSYRKFINLKSKSLISHVKFYFQILGGALKIKKDGKTKKKCLNKHIKKGHKIFQN